MLESILSKVLNNRSNFGDIWNVIDIHDGILVSHNPYAVTGIAQFTPGYIQDDDEWAHKMNKLVNQFISAPDGTVLNSYMIKYIGNPTMSTSGTHTDECINYLEQQRIQSFNKKLMPFYSTFLAITIPIEVKNTGRSNGFRKWIRENYTDRKLGKRKIARSDNWVVNEALSNEENQRLFAHASQTIKNLFSQINFKFGGGCKPLDTEGVEGFLNALLNHTQRPSAGIQSVIGSDVISFPKDGMLYYDGKWHATISARTKDLPTKIREEFGMLFFDDALKEIPFNVQCGIRFPSILKSSNEAQTIINWASSAQGIGLQGFRRRMAIVQEKMQRALDDCHVNGGRIIDMTYVICTWAESREELQTNIMTLQNALKGREMGMSRDTYNLKPAWFGLAPWKSGINKISTRLPSSSAELFIPVRYPYLYPNDKPPVKKCIFHTKYDQIIQFDPYDRSATCYNGLVVGTSGSGKSFSMNKMIMEARQSGDSVFIVDKGGKKSGSYRNLVHNIGGTYINIDFSANSQFAINPFDGYLFVRDEVVAKDEDGDEVEQTVPDLNGRVDPEKLAILLSMICQMISLDGMVTKEEEYLLQILLKLAYRETENNKGNKLTISIFANDYILKLSKDSNPEYLENLPINFAKETALGFFNKLNKFINDGIYSSFFKETKDNLKQDVFCFDLEGLDNHKELATIMTSVVLEKCFRLIMDGNPNKRKLVVFDEAWKYIAGGPLAEAIENIWRTVRKHGGRIYIVSQDLPSILESPIANAIKTSTCFYYLMGNAFDWDTVSKLSAPGKNGSNRISKYEFKGILDQKFMPPKYSEGFLLTPVYSGTFRHYAAKADYWMATTDVLDKGVLRKYMSSFGTDYVNSDVLKAVVNDDV